MTPATATASPGAEQAHLAERIQYWNDYLAQPRRYEAFRRYYRRRLMDIYRFLIPPGMRVLEIGCGPGDLLAAVQPRYGVGVDVSAAMVAAARQKHPELHFVESDAATFALGESFDYIICSDLVGELWDVQKVFEVVAAHAHPTTRFILNFHNNLWQGPRRAASAMGIARPLLTLNWLTPEDVANLLYLADFEVIRTSNEILWPVRTPLLDTVSNRFLVKLWPFRLLGLTNVLIARPKPRAHTREPIVSVVVPARNEAGNVPAIFDRVPEMGGGTELIFVEGGSKDNTYAAIEQEMARRKRPLTKLLRQAGKGKGDAVRLGFANAEGELLMILDADLTVPPEDLPRFYEAWRSGKGDFINGVRLVYPMEERAMRFFNLLGNRFFSLAFSFLLGQSLKDSLCGTKVLSKEHYETIAANRAYFGHLDPFGDFDLIFGAAKYNLKIVDLPIRYRERVYGETNIRRWSHGWLLLRMVMLGLRRLKFV